jgi:hypothetical protein
MVCDSKARISVAFAVFNEITNATRCMESVKWDIATDRRTRVGGFSDTEPDTDPGHAGHEIGAVVEKR